MRTARDKLRENGTDDEIELIDDEAFVESLVGVQMTATGYVAVYDYNLMVDEYAKVHGLPLEEAADYVSHNIIRGLSYRNGEKPIVFDS